MLNNFRFVKAIFIFHTFNETLLKPNKMKKQLLFVFTASISLALVSCEKNNEKLEKGESSNTTELKIDKSLYDVQQKSNKSFEELKREAEIKTLKAKERIKYSDEESKRSFEKLKREADEATREANEQISQ